MADYNNSRYTYNQVLGSSGYYYMQDDSLRYSEGVETMQTRLNKAGFWCGTPDGKFGSGTDEAVRHFQRAYGLAVDGKAGRNTLVKLNTVSGASPGFTLTSGTYGVYFDGTNKRFMNNQQIVYDYLKAAGLNKHAIAGIMGNIHAEKSFSTAWTGNGSSVGLCQWTTDRGNNLKAYATSVSKDKTDVVAQARFILEECKAGGTYADSYAVKCMTYLKNTSVVTNTQVAADYFAALYERCENYSTWTAVKNSSYDSSRFSINANAYNGKYYLDTPKRRGYAAAYYSCMQHMA